MWWENQQKVLLSAPQCPVLLLLLFLNRYTNKNEQQTGRRAEGAFRSFKHSSSNEGVWLRRCNGNASRWRSSRSRGKGFGWIVEYGPYVVRRFILVPSFFSLWENDVIISHDDGFIIISSVITKHLTFSSSSQKPQHAALVMDGPTVSSVRAGIVVPFFHDEDRRLLLVGCRFTQQ